MYGVYLLVTREAKFMTFVLGRKWWIFKIATTLVKLIELCHRIAGYFYGTIGAFGITAGAHRLWAHKSYKATWQLRLILATVNLIAFQNSIHEWVRDHRVHHKYTDTNADPHNSKRGFFFSHMGWLVLRKHPDVKTKGANVSMADLEEDQIVMFQKKLETIDFREIASHSCSAYHSPHRYYLILMPTFAFILPTLIPYLVLGEKLTYSSYIAGALRYLMTLHFTWLVNSAAHIWGMRPYDQWVFAMRKPIDINCNNWIFLFTEPFVRVTTLQ